MKLRDTIDESEECAETAGEKTECTGATLIIPTARCTSLPSKLISTGIALLEVTPDPEGRVP